MAREYGKSMQRRAVRALRKEALGVVRDLLPGQELENLKNLLSPEGAARIKARLARLDCEENAKEAIRRDFDEICERKPIHEDIPANRQENDRNSSQ